MKNLRYLILSVLSLFAFAAYAQYDVGKRNFYNDISSVTVGSAGANDFVQVFSVSNTINGEGSAKKMALRYLTPTVADLTATNTLTTADCGKTLLLNSATEFATTLPAPTSGCKLKFFVKAAPSGASYTIVATSNVIIGGVNELEVDTGDDGPYSATGTTITFVDGVAVKGDFVEMISDGTSWYMNGQTNADGGVTIT